MPASLSPRCEKNEWYWIKFQAGSDGQGFQATGNRFDVRCIVECGLCDHLAAIRLHSVMLME